MLGRVMARWSALLCAGALVVSPQTARAEDFLRDQSGYAVMVGPNAGGGFHRNPGTLLGVEVSFVRFDDGLWFGFYGDFLHDLGVGRSRLSFGPELGLGPFGLDVGYVQEVSVAQPMHGFRVRALLSAFFVSAYAGPGELHVGQQRFTYREAGLLFKAPLARF